MLILNGQLYEPGAPELSLLNRSFKYGDGLFESIRVHQGRTLFLKNHLERLVKGMKLLQFEFEEAPFVQTLTQEIQRVQEVNALEGHGRIRLHVYRSGEGAFLPLDLKPYYLIEAYTLKTDYYQHPHPAHLTDFRDITIGNNELSRFKTANSLPYILGAIAAQKASADEAVMYYRDFIAETHQANLFIVKQQKVYTPPLKHGCLNGIMRKHIFSFCQELKLVCKEKSLKPKDLLGADEIFVTNTIRGIRGVKQYRDQLFSQQAPITSFLQNCLLDFVSNG